MNVLFVHNFYQQPGGEDQVFRDEAALIESRGHTVVRHSVHNDSVESMGRVSLAVRTVWNRESYDTISQLVRQHNVSVVHFHNTFPLISPAAYYAARRAGAAVVQGIPNYRLLCPAAIFMRNGRICEDCLTKRIKWPAVAHACYRDSRIVSGVVAGMLAVHRAIGTWSHAVDIYIALTEFVRDKLIEGGIPATRIRVKGNFVAPDPGEGTGQGGYAVFVGRLTPEKGISTLIKAWTRLGVGMRLKVIGDGPDAQAVKNAAAHNPAIEWLGRRPVDEVLKIVGEASFLVFPSEWYEGQPKVIIEALAKGTPVVAARLGSMTEMVSDGKDGALFTPGDSDDLANKLLALAADPETLIRMRRTARATWERKYTAQLNYRNLLAVYQEAVAARNAHRAMSPLDVPHSKSAGLVSMDSQKEITSGNER
jgi:glycosyltransferase involved in cell wall biosynthesis